MALSAKVGSFNIDTTKTAGQTQAISGVGFQPKIVLFFWGGSIGTGDTVSGGSVFPGFGAAISSSSRCCVSLMSLDNAAESVTGTASDAAHCIAHFSSAGDFSQEGLLDFSSMDADGFTLVVDNQYGVAYRISYLALGGADLSNVFIGSTTTPTATGNYSVTSVGFQPNALLTVGMPAPNATGEEAHANLFIGMATASDQQGVVALHSRYAQSTSSTFGYGYDGEVMAWKYQYGAIDIRESLVSFDADGFTLNHLEGGTAKYYFYICLKGGQYRVGGLTTRTDGNDIAITAPGFQPAALLFASANRALSTQDTASAHARLSIGAATSTSERACAAISDEDNLATTETAYANYDSAVYANVVDDATAGLMDIKSIDASGFTCVMDDADPSGCWVSYLAIGAAATATGQPFALRGVYVPGMRQWQPGRGPGF